MIYLDNSATTELDPAVAEAMAPYRGTRFGNASSIYALGREAHNALEDSRSVVAAAIGADPSEVVFTSGGTEANNHAIKGAVFQSVANGKRLNELSVITSPAEHHAVGEPIKFLESLGVNAFRVAVNSAGAVDPLTVVGLSGKPHALASFMLVNNEVGTINPIQEISSSLHAADAGTMFHCDAVQGLGKITIDVRTLGVDLLSISAHKIHGPKGIGALFIRRGVKIEPLLHGGSQERNRRGGTESVALAVGFAEAIRRHESSRTESTALVRSLREYALGKLSTFPEVIFNSPLNSDAVNGILNISFVPEVLSRVDGEALLIRFDLEGIAVSNGSACTSGSIQASHVLLAMGKGPEIASKSIRISFSRFSTIEDIDRFVEALARIIRD